MLPEQRRNYPPGYILLILIDPRKISPEPFIIEKHTMFPSQNHITEKYINNDVDIGLEKVSKPRRYTKRQVNK
jgi:hypothetical protein